MPPAFVLSQDQTLKLNSPSPEGRRKVRELSFAQIFGLTKRCTNTDRSYGAESTQRPPPAHPFYVYLQCQRARSKSKKGNPPPAKEPPAVNFRERGSNRPRNRCQTLKIRRSHYIPKSQKNNKSFASGAEFRGSKPGGGLRRHSPAAFISRRGFGPVPHPRSGTPFRRRRKPGVRHGGCRRQEERGRRTGPRNG